MKGVFTMWFDNYLRSWTDPIKEQPNAYPIEYIIKLNEGEVYEDLLFVRLDSSFNLIQESSEYNIQFSEYKNPPVFTEMTIINKKAIEICEDNKLSHAPNSEYTSKLKFERNKLKSYAGEYYYEVIQKYDEETEGSCYEDCTITMFYNVWRINPWNSELIFHSKMMEQRKYLNGHGTGGLLEKVND